MDLELIFTGKSFLYGFLIWLIPFVIGFFAYPLKNKCPMSFKTLMAIVLVLVTVVVSHHYFTDTRSLTIIQGVALGFLWAFICMAIDLPIFIFGFKSKPCSYFCEIGIAYLIIPMITWSNVSLIEMLRHI